MVFCNPAMFSCNIFKVSILANILQPGLNWRARPLFHVTADVVSFSLCINWHDRMRYFVRTGFNPDPQHQPAPLVILLVPLRDPGLHSSEI